MSAPLALSAPPGRIIAIASGKGGVGKTWLAITLAHAFARQGRRALVLDGDFGLANADVQLGLTPRQGIAEVLAGRLTPEEAATSHAAGFHLLAGRSGSGVLAGLAGPSLDAALSLPRRAASAWQEVVLDLGAGIETPQRRLVAQADLLLVVATEEPTSLTDAYAVLKLAVQDAPALPARLVVNLAGSAGSAERTWRTLETAAHRFLGRDLPLAGIIRRDAKVPDAIRHQSPILTRHPASPAAEDVLALARGLG